MRIGNLLGFLFRHQEAIDYYELVARNFSDNEMLVLQAHDAMASSYQKLAVEEFSHGR
jgi:hypothetical protein